VVPVDQLDAESFGLRIHHQSIAGGQSIERVAACLFVRMGARDVDVSRSQSVGRRRAFHRRGRVSPKTCLKGTHDRLADARQRRLRPGHRADSVHHFAGPGIDEHFEELFAAFGVVRQRSVREAEASFIVLAIHAVEHSTTVQGPEPNMADQHRDNGSDHNGRFPRERFDPPDVELLPCDEGSSCSLEIGGPVSDRDCRFFNALAGGLGSHYSYRAVRQGQVSGLTNETVDGFQRRASSQEHGSSDGDGISKQRVTNQLVDGDHKPSNGRHAKRQRGRGQQLLRDR
jgi:hypothetical protein